MKTRSTLSFAMLFASALFIAFPILLQGEDESSPNSLKMSESVDYPMGEFPQSVALADLNGDDLLDVITANRRGNSVTVRLGKEDGTFGGSVTYETGEEPIFVQTGDLNNNGNLDLITANRSNSLTILPGNGDGTFGEAIQLAIGDGSEDLMPISIAVADFNGDGIADLAVSNFLGNSAALFLGKGEFTFDDPTFLPIGDGPISVVSADFNDDGNIDLAFANRRENTATILLGDGNGSFEQSTVEIGERAGYIAVGDLNNDGIPDLAIPNFSDLNISLLIGDGSGNFTRRDIEADVCAPSSIALGDIDGDGWLDMVATCQSLGGVTVFLNKGDASFEAEPVGFITGMGPDSVALGDLNGDGLADIVAANLSSNSISVILSGGESAAQTQREMANRGSMPRTFGEGSATLVAEFEVPEGVPAEFEEVQVIVASLSDGFFDLTNAPQQTFREKSFKATFEDLPLGEYLLIIVTGKNFNDSFDASRPGAFRTEEFLVLSEDSATVRHSVKFEYFDANSYRGAAVATGKVIDIENNPVANIELEASVSSNTAGRLEIGTAQTDDDGNFRFENLAEDKTYSISFASERLGSITPGKENVLTLGPQVGQAAPDIEFTHLETDQLQKLSDFRGKVVLIDFWAVWCGPCQDPMEKMQHYRDANPHWGDQVELIALSIDDQRKQAERHLEVQGWTKSYNVWAPGGFYSKPAEVYNITGIPTFFLIDAEGKIVRKGHPSTVDLPSLINMHLPN